MVLCLQTIPFDVLLLLLLLSLMSICMTNATSTLSSMNVDNNYQMKQADECKYN
jgi:hypothetical protein